jgi:alginate O-acetyltransferase complex protein AlgI
MIFSSLEFIFIFFPVVFFGYFISNKLRLITFSKVWLIFSSLFFYSYWNINYLPLILSSIFVNFAISKILIEYGNYEKIYFSKKIVLVTGIIFNLSLLGYFKYMDFFIININYLSDVNIELFNFALPLAISFFTLQQIAFIIDSYENLVKEKNFINYSLFVTFFPQLIAGPIVHHKEMMPQFDSLKKKILCMSNLKLGFFIFSIGLFKKIILADTFSVWSDFGFSNSASLTFFQAWATSLSYSFQLYFDFSGYTDMAIGLALMFNISLPHNFNSPFQATSIIDFWKRWHMTLTNFIASYIYTPLLMSFKKINLMNAMLATFITMQIAGIWHGAEWKYIVFGTLHSSALVLNHLWKSYKLSLNKIVAWLITFLFINITFTIFRGEDLYQSFTIIKTMFDFTEFSFSSKGVEVLNIIYISIAIVFVLYSKNTLYFISNIKYNIPSALLLFFIAILQINHILISDDRLSKFIYFNF